MAAEPDTQAFTLTGVGVSHRGRQVLRDIDLDIRARAVTAVIGPSGSGKTTLLQCLNRMTHERPGAQVTGTIRFGDLDLADEDIDPVLLRRRIGLLMDQPTPFPQSIHDNVAFGLRTRGVRRGLRRRVTAALDQAGLLEEVAGRMHEPALRLSVGQQQRLCLARLVAVDPDVILMDNPAGSLDHLSTLALEDHLRRVAADRTVVLVTHDLQQAARASDRTVLLAAAEGHGGSGASSIVEEGPTARIFTAPACRRTRDYVTVDGRWTP